MFGLALSGFLMGCSALAQTAPISTEAKLAAVESAAKAAQSAGDNAWMLVSAALVLMMTGPGLALFYGGLVRPQECAGHHDAQLHPDGGRYCALGGVRLQSGVRRRESVHRRICNICSLSGVGSAPNPDYAATIPHQTFMVYQLMFAIITPALISGAFAERMKFSAMLLFTILWSTVVYFPMAHMVWGKGGLLNAFLGGTIPLFRFCRRHRRPHHFGRLGAGLRAVSGQAARLPDGTDEAAQSGDQRHRRLPAVGGLVRLQRGQRARRLGSCHQRVCGNALRRRGRDAGLAAGRMAETRQAQHAGRHLGRGCGTGRHHAGVGLREAVSGAADRFLRGAGLLLHGDEGEEQVRV